MLSFCTLYDCTGLKDPTCSGLCRIGHFCPEASTTSVQVLCPAGTYGADEGLSSAGCSGPCSPGYYCPTGSTKSTAFVCGTASVYCPTGSKAPTPVSPGYFTVAGGPATRQGQEQCPAGSYCHEGVPYLCPPGTYGATPGLEANVKPFLYGNNLYDYICSGELHPFPLQTRSRLSNQVDCPHHLLLLLFAWWSGLCDPGFYCPAGSTSPRQIPCPAGTYGDTYGLQNSSCTAICPLGHHCPAGTVSPIPCRAGLCWREGRYHLRNNLREGKLLRNTVTREKYVSMIASYVKGP